MAGFTLFDGKNLNQWQGDGTATFQIEDGSVIAADKKDPKAVAAYLVSKSSLSRISRSRRVLGQRRCQQRHLVRNNRSEEYQQPNGYEVNIFDQRPDPSMAPAASFPCQDPGPDQGRRQVNTYEIVARGRSLPSRSNGVKTVDGAEMPTTRKADRTAVRRRHGEIPQGQIKPL